MKRILTILILALTPQIMTAQSSMDEFFSSYSGRQGYQSIIYGKRMLDMMKEDASPDVRSLLNRISTIRITSHKQQMDEIADISRRHLAAYEIISKINENGNLSEFYISDNIGKSKNVSFVMIISGPQGTAVMEIIGQFDVKDISKLSVIGQK